MVEAPAIGIVAFEMVLQDCTKVQESVVSKIWDGCDA